MARYKKGTTPKLTNKLINEISTLLRKGNYIETSAAACGISKDTLYRWLRNAKSDEATELEVKLSDAVIKSQALAEIDDLNRIDHFANSPDGFRAVAWRLERRFPKRWGCKHEPIDETNEIYTENKNEMVITFVDSPYLLE